MRQLLLTTILLCFQLSFAFGQKEIGMPFIQHYLPADYDAGSQNWDIIQDDNGIIYVGNNKGLLQYDGQHWELIATTNKSTVRSLGYHDGVIYVGAENELGFLQPTTTGDLHYHSLLPYLDSTYLDFNIVWNIQSNHEGVFFRTSKYILRWQAGQFRAWKHDKRLARSFLIHDQYYVQERGGQLLTIEGDSLKLAPNGEQVDGMRIQAMLPYETDQVLVIPNSSDAYLLELKEGGSFVPFQGQAVNEFCKSGVVYDQAILSDGTYVLCTIGNGAIAFNKEGQILQYLNKKFGLADEVMICLYTDQAGGLWAGLNTGVARIEMNSPFRIWDDRQGLEGAVSDAIRIDGTLYVATVRGLYYHNGSEFEAIAGIEDQTWEIMPYVSGNRSTLLVGNYVGLFEVQKDKTTKQILDNSTVLALLHKQDQPKFVFAAGVRGLSVLEDQAGNWVKVNHLDNLPGEISSMCEDNQHHIWVSTNKHELLRLTFPDRDYTQAPKVIIYDETKGVPNTDFTKIYFLQNKVLAATEVGVLAYDPESDAFLPYPNLGEKFAGKGTQVYLLEEGNDQAIWVASLLTSGVIGKVSYVDGNPKLYSAPFKRLPKTEMYSSYFEQNNFSYWLCADKLYRFSDQVAFEEKPAFNTLIRHVAINDDSTIFWGNYFNHHDNELYPLKLAATQPADLIPALPYADNTITFEYAATSYDQEKLNEYSYQLVGHDAEGQWSSWTTDTKKQYTDLFESDYVFRVKARNIYGKESEVAAYAFSVSPPWYRSPIAYFSYLLIAFVSVFAIVKLNAHRILLEKKYLEEVVAIRTKEIQQKNEEIAQQNSTLVEQKAIIEKKNKDTFDSIRYAERILNALHINPNKLKEELPESLVFFKPKDIVSGDFFWFTKEGDNLIIAAIDCTGHGIPGAFMSVIGQSLLKETVSMYGITEVDEILHALHAMLTASLAREKGASIEGMDMTICSINPIERKLHFAGAKNPLVYIRNNKLEIIKGNKLPVGGIRPDQERKFNKHTILLDAEPTSFYMFSDGFQDQFGGSKNRKFMPKRFRQLLLDIHQKSFAEQEQILDQTFEAWKGNEKQLDDVLVVGFKL
ncbi:MAG: SpoIIE family protein phosphatase [Flammeovirgaceae bacterium]